jgi:UDP-GlcNAc:undecaprenyl-phosphate GlcNAc-1-phosphate transferase
LIESSPIYPSFVFTNILLGLVLALVLGFFAIWIARRVGLIDVPGILPHKTHSSPVPLAGGLALVMVVAVGGVIANRSMVGEMWRILVPGVVVFGVGVWDDYKRLPARVKLSGQIIAVSLMVLFGIYVRIIPGEILGMSSGLTMLINILITFFWMIGIINAFNFIDSMDGIVVGIGGIAISFLVLVTLNSPQVALLRLLSLLLGCCVGLFFLNMTPARLFMGDAGAQTIGYLLAVIGILYTPTDFPQTSSWFLPILILGVPIFDTCLVVFSRLRKHQPVYRAGHNHTYHRLIKLGLDNNRAVAIMHIAGIILGCTAFIALLMPPLAANIIFGLTLLVGLGALLYLERKAG